MESLTPVWALSKIPPLLSSSTPLCPPGQQAACMQTLLSCRSLFSENYRGVYLSIRELSLHAHLTEVRARDSTPWEAGTILYGDRSARLSPSPNVVRQVDWLTGAQTTTYTTISSSLLTFLVLLFSPLSPPSSTPYCFLIPRPQNSSACFLSLTLPHTYPLAIGSVLLSPTVS